MSMVEVMTAQHSTSVIDIGPYLDNSASSIAREQVIEQVKTACSTYGFLQVKCHGVSSAAQDGILQACRTLFGLPQEQKDAMSLLKNPARRGYEKLGGQVLDIAALPDLKENENGFYLGCEVPPDDTGLPRDPNEWPELPSSDFRQHVTEYSHHMLKLGKALLEMMVIGLGHDISVLDGFTKGSVAKLKLLRYPPHSSKDEKHFGAGAYTDFGSITMLLQQPGKDGLQVYHADSGEWLPVLAVEDIIVNILC